MWSIRMVVVCLLIFTQTSRLQSLELPKFYWNIPTFQCDSFKLDFTRLGKKFNIIQNNNDRFRGEHITILYDPGNFPAILTKDGTTMLRNGGIPQAGNLTVHLQQFERIVDDLIPDRGFTGAAIIDFESWRPIFRQNFGTLAPYKELAYDYERQKHPFWPQFLIEKEAIRNFERYAKVFMDETLLLARKLRKWAKWGYYGYPLCFNMTPKNMRQNCPKEVVMENDRLDWLFDLCDNLYPSVYLNNRLTRQQKIEMIQGRICEAQRIVKSTSNWLHHPKILTYFWYKYQDTNEFVSKEDLISSIQTLIDSDVDGVIIWGSSNDVNSKQKCLHLYEYIDNVLGPIIKEHLNKKSE